MKLGQEELQSRIKKEDEELSKPVPQETTQGPGFICWFFTQIGNMVPAAMGIFGVSMATLLGFSLPNLSIGSIGNKIIGCCKNLNFISLGVAAVPKLFTVIVSTIKFVFDEAKAVFTSHTPLRKFQKEVGQWVTDCSYFQKGIWPTVVMRNPANAFVYFFLIETGLTINTRRLEIDPLLRPGFDEALKRMLSFYQFTHLSAHMASGRPEPLCIRIYGDSGIGKTNVLHELRKDLTEAMSLHPGYYSINWDLAHMNGYYGQEVAVDDDADVMSNVENMATRLKAETKTPIVGASAALEDKNRPILWKLVIKNTNNPFPKFDGMFNPEAYWRRSWLVHAEKTDKPVDNTTNKYLNTLKFTVLVATDINKVPLHPNLVDLTYTQLAEWARNLAQNHVAQEKVRSIEEGAYSFRSRYEQFSDTITALHTCELSAKHADILKHAQILLNQSRDILRKSDNAVSIKLDQYLKSNLQSVPLAPNAFRKLIARISSMAHNQTTFDESVACVGEDVQTPGPSHLFSSADIDDIFEDARNTPGLTGTSAPIGVDELVRRSADRRVRGIRENTDQDCRVCFLPITTCAETLECGHMFHESCLRRWFVLNKTCPLCRETVSEAWFMRSPASAPSSFSFDPFNMSPEDLGTLSQEVVAAFKRGAVIVKYGSDLYNTLVARSRPTYVPAVINGYWTMKTDHIESFDDYNQELEHIMRIESCTRKQVSEELFSDSMSSSILINPDDLRCVFQYNKENQMMYITNIGLVPARAHPMGDFSAIAQFLFDLRECPNMSSIREFVSQNSISRENQTTFETYVESVVKEQGRWSELLTKVLLKTDMFFRRIPRWFPSMLYCLAIAYCVLAVCLGITMVFSAQQLYDTPSMGMYVPVASRAAYSGKTILKPGLTTARFAHESLKVQATAGFGTQASNNIDTAATSIFSCSVAVPTATEVHLYNFVAVGLTGTVFMANHHSFLPVMALKQFRFIIRDHSRVLDGKIFEQEFVLTPSDLKKVFSKDAVLFSLPGFRSVKNITDRFITRKTLQAAENGTIPGLSVSRNKKSCNIVSMGDLTLMTHGEYETRFVDYTGEEPVDAVKHVSNDRYFLAQTINSRNIVFGMSGSLVLHTYSPFGDKVFIGMIGASSAITTHIVPITSEDIATTMNCFSKSDCIDLRNPILPSVTPSPLLARLGGQSVVGQWSPPLHTPPRSKYVKSPIFGEVEENTIEPAHLSDNHSWLKIVQLEPDIPHYMEKGLNKFHHTIPVLNPKLINKCAKDLAKYHFGKPELRMIELRQLSMVESILGFPHIGSKKLDLTKSSGLPYCQRNVKSGKKDLIDYDYNTGTLQLSNRFIDDYKHLKQNMSDGTIDKPIVGAFAKDELVAIGKNKTRTVFMLPTPIQVLTHELVGYWVANVQSAPIGSYPMIGAINQETSDYNLMISHLHNHSRIITLDCKNLDGSIPKLLKRGFATYLRELYSLAYKARSETPPVNFLDNIDKIFHAISESVIVYQDVCFEHTGGTLSGERTTTQQNSVVIFLMLYCSYYSYCINRKSHLASPESFFTIFSMFLLGDDAIISVSEEFIDIFTPEWFQQSYADHGITVTSTDKKNSKLVWKTITESSFLKMTPRYDLDIGQWVACPEKSIIAGLLNWLSTTEPVENQMQVNIYNALRFAFSWGREYYDELSDRIWSATRKLPFPIFIPHYELMYAWRVRQASLESFTIDPDGTS